MMLIETLFNIQGPYGMPKGYQPRNVIHSPKNT